MFLIYVFLEFLICSYTLAWTHGDNLNMISMNDSMDKDVEKLSHGSVLDGDVPKPKSCYRPSTCVPIKNNTCFGVRLPYTHTSLSLTGASNLDENLVSMNDFRPICRYSVKLNLRFSCVRKILKLINHLSHLIL